jgi:hypothetical protein
MKSTVRSILDRALAGGNDDDFKQQAAAAFADVDAEARGANDTAAGFAMAVTALGIALAVACLYGCYAAMRPVLQWLAGWHGRRRVKSSQRGESAGIADTDAAYIATMAGPSAAC